jgi:predicted phage-related endonuclease
LDENTDPVAHAQRGNIGNAKSKRPATAGIRGNAMSIQTSPGTVDFDEGIAQWLQQYKHARDEIARWEEVADIARSHVESAMGEAETALYQNKPVVRWTRVESRRFDTKKAREILPSQVIDLLEVISTSRRFVIVDQEQQ